MQWLYLIGLIVAIGCLMLIDWRSKLVLWHDLRRSVMTIGLSMAVFIIWDLFGIQLGIFFSGHSPYALDFMLLPDFPVEELFFLFLLCYLTLLIYRLVRTKWKPTLS